MWSGGGGGGGGGRWMRAKYSTFVLLINADVRYFKDKLLGGWEKKCVT